MRRTLLPLLLFLASCQPPAPPNLTGSGMDMFAPASIRLHPLTRLVFPLPALSAATAPATRPSQPPAPWPTLETYLEFSDQFGDPTKGAGTLSIELFDQPPLSHKGPRLDAWSVSLQAPEENRDHWDRMTRTYLFKLPLTVALPANRPHLLVIATLTLPNHQTLTDDLELPIK